MSAIGDLGAYIRQQRRNAQISLRQLAEKAGVSNPYLSQIERGLRKPSADVLRQVADALRIATPVMFRRAGLLPAVEPSAVLAAIEADNDLTVQQKTVLSEIYRKFQTVNEATSPEKTAEETP